MSINQLVKPILSNLMHSE